MISLYHSRPDRAGISVTAIIFKKQPGPQGKNEKAVASPGEIKEGERSTGRLKLFW